MSKGVIGDWLQIMNNYIIVTGGAAQCACVCIWCLSECTRMRALVCVLARERVAVHTMLCAYVLACVSVCTSVLYVVCMYLCIVWICVDSFAHLSVG